MSSGAKLEVEWIIDENDLALMAKFVPGASVNLLRWPVAFCVAYVGVAASDPGVGWLFAVLSALVIGGLWVLMLLGLRGHAIRKQARLPEAVRRVRCSLEGDTLRLEDAGGHATERPVSELSGAVVRPEGVLLRIGNQALFLPDRALGAARDAWHEGLSRVPAWTQPIGHTFTYLLWVFASFVALYALVR